MGVQQDKRLDRRFRSRSSCKGSKGTKSLRAFAKIVAIFQVFCLLALAGIPEVIAKDKDRDFKSRQRPISLTVVVKGEGTVTSSPEGLSCANGTCSAQFPRGSVVRLYATPGEGEILSRWRGACSGKRHCKVRLRRPRTVLASFRTPRPVPLVVYVRGEGKVTSMPEGISCTKGACKGKFPRGTVVRLHAEPGEGHVLHRWRGACWGSKGCRIKLKGPRKVLARFRTPPLVPLKVFMKGEGTVASSPEGLECSDKYCKGRFPKGTVVTLKAIPKEGHSFSRWYGRCRGKETCTIKLKRPRRILAKFSTAPPPKPVSLIIALKGEGKVISSPEGIKCEEDVCKGEYPQGTVVTLKPMAAEEHLFSEWDGSCKGSEECTVTLSTPGEVEFTVTFIPEPPPPEVTLTINITGQGKVSSKPEGIVCEDEICAGKFPQGAVVNLSAMPGEDQVFSEWSGACTGSEGCTVTLRVPVVLTATFVPPPPPPDVPLTAAVVGNGSVISTPAGLVCPTGPCAFSFPSGTSVTLNATPNAGHSFSGWSGACSGIGSCTVTLTAASTATATFIPSTPGGMTDAEAIRFLEQSTWGPTPASIAHVKSVGKDAFLAEQFAAAPSAYPDPDDESNSLGPLQDQWFHNVFHGQDQLRQRVAFALSQLFVVSARGVGSDDQMIPYQRMLMNHAFGNFYDLMRDVTLSPTMGRYLDMVNNDKTEPGSGLNPNENYARELLQLFSVGTKMLNIDGSEQMDSSGQPIPPYDQDVIINLSRVFTGWTYPTRPGETPRWRNPSYYAGPMEAIDEHHDMETKVLMNGFIVPANGTAQQDLDAALTHIFQHSNVGPFVATRLIRNLVTSNPSPAYIQRVAAVFNSDQAGVRGNMQAVIRAILIDPEAATVVPDGGHLREPILYAVALLRALNADVQLDHPLYSRTRDMGQTLFSPPSVFNFFSPLYKIPGTNLYGPEYQIHTLTNSIARANFVNRVVNDEVGGGVTVDLSAIEAVAADAGQLVAAVERALLHGNLSDAERQSIMTAVSVSDNPTTRARTAVYLVATSAKYQIQH